MKNFQQTPKMRRLMMASHKTAFVNSRARPFQPREAWTTKRKLGGVALSVLDTKQWNRQNYRRTPWDYSPFEQMAREARRF